MLDFCSKTIQKDYLMCFMEYSTLILHCSEVVIDSLNVNLGVASCHCVALDVEGRCYTWGRNEACLHSTLELKNVAFPCLYSV